MLPHCTPDVLNHGQLEEGGHSLQTPDVVKAFQTFAESDHQRRLDVAHRRVGDLATNEHRYLPGNRPAEKWTHD